MIFNISYPLGAKSGSVYTSDSVPYTNRVLCMGFYEFGLVVNTDLWRWHRIVYTTLKKTTQNSQHMGDDEYGGQWQIVVEAEVAFLAGFLVLLLI